MTVTDFLLARFDDDEATARCAAEDSFLGLRGRIGISDDPWPTELRFADRFTPSRVLAEVEAKRRIVEAHPHRDTDDLGCGTCDWQEWWPGTFREPCPTLRALALPYADHPDYRQEWKP